VLSTAVGRVRWLGSHLFFALLGPAATLTAAGVAIGLTHGLNVRDVGGELPRLLAGTVVQLPAVWILSAITVLLFGVLPRLTGLAWAALAACLLFGMVGSAMGLSQWVLDISPFTHLPHLPGGHVTALPLILLCAIAITLTMAGVTGFRRRDVPA
jgi:ABC-2 type transport system permease protein